MVAAVALKSGVFDQLIAQVALFRSVGRRREADVYLVYLPVGRKIGQVRAALAVRGAKSFDRNFRLRVFQYCPGPAMLQVTPATAVPYFADRQ
jgi:hypothetical protein